MKLIKEPVRPKTPRSGLDPRNQGVNRQAKKLADIVITYSPVVYKR